MKSIKCKIVVGLAAFACSLDPGLGQGITLTFDDLPGSYGVVPTGYSGFQWSNFHYIEGTNATRLQDDGYRHSTISPSIVAFNDSGNSAQIRSLTPFLIVSGYFTAAWHDDLQFQMQGFLRGVPVFDNTYLLSPAGPTLISLSVGETDQVNFISFGGTPRWDYVSGLQFAMDDLALIIVPEPSPQFLGLTGFALVAISRLKCWQLK